MKSKKTIVFKLILAIISIIAICAITAYLFPVIKNLATPEGQQAFKNRIESTGFLGMLILFMLEVAQIFLFIIPGEPIELLAGLCYGGLGGAVFILVSCGIITTAIVLLVNKFGRKFIYSFFNEAQTKKLENSKLFQNPKTIEIIMIILFILPGTPKDLLTFIGALLPINPIRFILIATLARIPSIVSSTVAASLALEGNIKYGIIMYLGIFVGVGIGLFIFNRFDKHKSTEQVIKSIRNKEK